MTPLPRWLLVITVNVVLLEAGSYGVLVWAKSYNEHYFGWPPGFFERYVRDVDDEYIRKFAEIGHDPELGWNYRPHRKREARNAADETWRASYDAAGARTNPLFPDRVLIATYGDSYVHGDEIDDHQTWQVLLSRKLEANVRNFGVGGYGTDQALLKLERHVASGPVPPIVILGIYEENMNRIVNTYRPFYSPKAGIKLGFKPRFILRDGKLDLVPNALPEIGERADVEAALAKAREHDGWVERNAGKVTIAFPFTFRLVDLLLSILHQKGLLVHPFKEVRGDLYVDVYESNWKNPENTRLLAAILERFVALSRDHRFQPVILFLPITPPGLDGDGPRPLYADFLDELRRREALSDAVVIDFAEARVHRDRYRVTPEGGHPSAYGHERIGEFVHARLCEQAPDRLSALGIDVRCAAVVPDP